MLPHPVKMLCASAFIIAAASLIHADERIFAYSYQADSVLPKGAFEIENWATMRAGKDSGHFVAWDTRYELEYGFTETFTGALYFNSMNILADGVETLNNMNSTRFAGISIEMKNMFLSPYTNPVGVLGYFEQTYTGTEIELEGKLVLETIVDRNWHIATNLIVEQEWESTSISTQHTSVFEVTGGVGYRLDPTLSLGIEGRVRTAYTNFYETATSTAVFLGPSIHFGNEKFQITAAVLKQLTNVYQGAESMEARVITGINL